ncbi:cellulase family glycosylhydrolase [Sphingomonas sp. R-74633]|uniref:cellulase family glycosylhydrolase n=1 Tax=Sphingomonas sp. R-74633 TaxID=2751188 RepID=UPI0015D3CFCB|nr:cellulase family glycosylhydrolase [Sphingomonas sp. R-74633]NYT40684.1 cellulase family glycosylhydrolase [Sphingomonas sp. R-74633]
MIRARLFAAALAALAAGAAMPVAAQGVHRDREADIRGGIYVTSDAYNAPQMWKNFNAKEIDRDLGYAQKIHLNALRVWASYEYWQTNPADFQAKFDQFLALSHKHGIRILISLFENDGVAPTPEHMWSIDPKTAFSIQSPGNKIANGPEEGWAEPRGFVEWFMKRYGKDDRLIAIEVMNEPRAGKDGAKGTLPFTHAMLATAKALQGSVPLTVGTARIGEAKALIPLGIDIIEIHNNFPRDPADMKNAIEQAMAVGKEANLPVWLTEWQRVRPGGNGRGGKGIANAERGPDYASLASTVNAYPVATFFWSVMVKPAYLQRQRHIGTVNGLFWPDGSVVSLKDARAIAEDPKLVLREKPIPETFGMGGVQSKPDDKADE